MREHPEPVDVSGGVKPQVNAGRSPFEGRVTHIPKVFTLIGVSCFFFGNFSPSKFRL